MVKQEKYALWMIIGFLLSLGGAVVAAALSGCETKSDPSPQKIEVYDICKRMFTPTLEEYEKQRKVRVPDSCRTLDTKIQIAVIEQEKELEVLCGTMTAANEQLAGCATNTTMYINGTRSQAQQIDNSVHEWLHYIIECHTGSWDPFHLDGKVWIQYGGDTAEAWALAATLVGSCLP